MSTNHYKEYQRFIILNEAIANMGLETHLLFSQMAKAYKGKAKSLLAKDLGIDITGSDVKSVAESFSEQIKKLGVCQRVNIVESTDEKLVVDIGECVFSQASNILAKEEGTDYIPVCPMIAMLEAEIEEVTGKTLEIEKRDFDLGHNSCIFSIITLSS